MPRGSGEAIGTERTAALRSIPGSRSARVPEGQQGSVSERIRIETCLRFREQGLREGDIFRKKKRQTRSRESYATGTNTSSTQ